MPSGTAKRSEKKYTLSQKAENTTLFLKLITNNINIPTKWGVLDSPYFLFYEIPNNNADVCADISI